MCIPSSTTFAHHSSRPGGKFGLFDLVRGPSYDVATLSLPLPFATSRSECYVDSAQAQRPPPSAHDVRYSNMSAIVDAQTYRDAFSGAGLDLDAETDRTQANVYLVITPTVPRRRLNPHADAF